MTDSSLKRIDPDWAWSPFRPNRRQPWDRRLAAHLLRRAGFGASWSELDEAVGREPQEVVSDLLSPEGSGGRFAADSERLGHALLATGNPQRLSAWWVYTLLATPDPLRERMTLFWHGHFATSAEKVDDIDAMYQQNRLLRRHALGDFAQLVHAISRDPAMLVYLDSATNRKAHPNENFARELMELFCLGEGSYTEGDIQQLARCFTGWEIRRGKFHFNRYQHDFGRKTFLGQSGTFPDGAAVDVVLDHPAGPRFIVAKLIRYLVYDEPPISDELVEPLAVELRERDWDIGPIVRRILGSQLFFSEHCLGRKVRSPVDLLVGLLRCLEGSSNANRVAEDLGQLGQRLFYPPNVKGWDGGRAWINSATLLSRANAVHRILRDDTTRFAGEDLASYFRQQGARSAAEIVDRLIQLTLATQPPSAARSRLEDVIEDAAGTPSTRIAQAIRALCALPEFHLC